MYELQLTDEQYQTLYAVLYLVERADKPQKAVWLSESDRKQIADVLGTVQQAEQSDEMAA